MTPDMFAEYREGGEFDGAHVLRPSEIMFFMFRSRGPACLWLPEPMACPARYCGDE